MAATLVAILALPAIVALAAAALRRHARDSRRPLATLAIGHG